MASVHLWHGQPSVESTRDKHTRSPGCRDAYNEHIAISGRER